MGCTLSGAVRGGEPGDVAGGVSATVRAALSARDGAGFQLRDCANAVEVLFGADVDRISDQGERCEHLLTQRIGSDDFMHRPGL